ncbi:HAMP domain-containing histidine kinase [Candidatus Curtissbacteria bacterium]|nr:HAMP domain-containing histidine kinase [Candidatus Curtissbacteria bacterium]
MPEVGAPEQTITKEEEKKPIKLVGFKVDEKAFEPETYKKLNQIAQAVNRLGETASLLRAFIIQESEAPGNITDRMKAINQKINDWLKLSDKMAGVIYPLIEEGEIADEVEENEVKDLAKRYQLENWPAEEVVRIPISTEDQIEELMARLSVAGVVHHDTRSPIHLIKGYLDLIEEEGPEEIFLNEVSSGSTRLLSDTEYCLRLLENPYLKEEINIGRFVSGLNTKFMAAGIKPSVSFVGVDENTKVQWSKGWLESLSSNLANNTKKAYRSKNIEKGGVAYIDVSSITDDEGQKFVEVSVEDRGPGFPDDFTGFKKRYTKWGRDLVQKASSGLGMYNQLISLEQHYGGKLIPENVKDDEGNVIGARIRVRLPL